MKIYTLTGDDGTTSLSGGKRVPKHSLRVEAYGSVDELIAWVGLLRDNSENLHQKEFLIYIQDQLMRCAAALAFDYENGSYKQILPDSASINKIEHEIDCMEEKLPLLKNFILPGGNSLISYCHITRCVCRRAERAVLRLRITEEVPLIVCKILNRLSDYFFVLARHTGLEPDTEEVRWQI